MHPAVHSFARFSLLLALPFARFILGSCCFVVSQVSPVSQPYFMRASVFPNCHSLAAAYLE